jgi:zinc transport system ATP-binding protein
LFGTVLFERRAVRAGAANVLARSLARLAIFSPTSAAVLGVLFYFGLLALVSRLDVPASVPKLVMVLFVLTSFAVTRWADITARFAAVRANRSRIVARDAPFEAVGIHVEYPGFPKPIAVIRNAHLRVLPNTCSQIRGPNGSGKSTLLRYLAGRVAGTGVVSIPGAANTIARGRETLVGYVSQDADLGSCATLSVPENLALFKIGQTKSIWRRWQRLDDQRVPDPIRALVLSTNAIPAGLLSGGQRQVLGISAMIVRNDAPRVILFDEPLTHLDERHSLACVSLMETLLAEGRTILVVQHDVEPGVKYDTSSARARLSGLFTQTIDLAALEQGAAK